MLNLLLALTHIPQHSQSIRFRHFAEKSNGCTGINVYSELSENRYHFYQLTVVGTEITSLLPVFCEKLCHFLTWPTGEDWRSRQGIWTKLPIAVGALYGTSHRIYIPVFEPQELYYLGHRHFHCLHTPVVSDACDNTLHRFE